jgi:hypothetical protein
VLPLVRAKCVEWCPFLRGQQSLVCGLCLVLCGVAISSATACKYSVRDVAFVEMGDPQYRLYLYLDNATTAEDMTLLRSTGEHALADSNVACKVVMISQNPDKDDVAYLHKLGIDSYPSAVLVSPDERVKLLLLPSKLEDLAEAFQRTVTDIVRSTRRADVLSQLTTAHSVVLIIESNDVALNRVAKTMVRQAIDQIESTLGELPKPIAVPPRLISISPDVARQEEILLWSLGVDTETNYTTQIAMLFGRGRKLGPVLDVGKIKERDVLRSLSVVGLDCECGLDRSWMQAPMIPHVWTEADESRVAQALDFDPGHPLVKAEISRILMRGPSSQDLPESVTFDALLPGLQIIDLDFENDEFDNEIGKVHDRDDDAMGNNESTRTGSVSGSSARESFHGNVQSRLNTTEEASSDLRLQESAADRAVADTTNDRSASSMLTMILLGVVVFGFLGGTLILLSGRRSGS